MIPRTALRAWCFGLISLAACGAPPATGDGDGASDASSVDANTSDAGNRLDGANGTTDAGRTDARGMDAIGNRDVASPPVDVAPMNDTPTPPDDVPTPPADVPVNDAGPGPEWLNVVGNHIEFHDGTRFHGRGANLHDTRSCEACAWNDPDPSGVNRWADELIDHWHANFIRFLLSSEAAPYNSAEIQWQSIVDDPGYYQDIQTIVAHMSSKPGVYILVTLFSDPSMKPENSDPDSEWPTDQTQVRYQMLAEAFHDNPRVLFGLTNEPHGPVSGDAQLAAIYQQSIDTIRAVEDAHGSPHHIVVVQAPQGYSRDLSYFVANPIARDNVAYEVHPYNHQADFDALITQPAMTLPILIGEYGPADLGGGPVMTTQDIQALWTLAQSLEVPHIAWNFHMRCPPNLLQDTASDGCGLSASTGYDFPRTPWGDLLYNYLATPW